MQQQATAERVVPLLRVHADRVHDAVRRSGCTPAAAVQVVEASALDLVDAVAAGDDDDVLGAWFARADALAAQAQTGDDVPVGGGLLAADGDQALLGRALDALPDRQRLALLLRDSYDLPAASVGTALGTTADGAMAQVAAARLAFLPGIDGQASPSLGGHAADLAALGRIGEGGPVAAPDATARKHAQACALCRSVVEAQDYAHRLLSGLVVVALPEDERERLLVRVEQAVRTRLPSAASLVAAGAELDDEDDLPRRVLTPLAALLGLVLAAGLGLGLGLLTVRSPGGIEPADAAGELSVPVTAAAVPRVTPATAEQLRRAQSPPPAETRTFTLPVRTLPPPPPPPEPEPVSTTPLPQAAVTLSPAAGPGNSETTVAGTGWQPGTPVTIQYLDTLGQPSGSAATVVPRADGAFSTALATVDPANVPGEHTVRASNGVQPDATATYVVED